jgi:hypothetical protein
MQITTVAPFSVGARLPSAISYSSSTRFFLTSSSGSVLVFQVVTAWKGDALLAPGGPARSA